MLWLGVALKVNFFQDRIQMKRSINLLAFGFMLSVTTISFPANAQSGEADVRAAIDRLFEGMRKGDSTMVRSVLHEDALLSRISDRGIGMSSMDGFLDAVGTPQDQVWDERIWDVQIFVDGQLASAWMEFAFFLGDQMSHCGVNSMQLYQTHEGWKIFHLADTNRPPTCELPDEAP